VQPSVAQHAVDEVGRGGFQCHKVDRSPQRILQVESQAGKRGA